MKIIDQYKGLRKEIYVLFVCKLIDNAGSMIGPMFTLILSIKMGMNAKDIALFLSIFTILSMPVQLIGGKLGDRLNKKIVINICDILTSSIYIVCGVVGLNKVTLFFYMTGSLIQNVEGPIYDSLIADFTTSSDREKAYSLDYVGLNLGLALSPTIGGLLLENHLSLMFIISGVCELLSVIVFNIYIKQTYAIKDESNIYEATKETGNILDIFKENKILIYVLFIFSLGCFVYCMYNYLMPLTLSYIHGDLGSVYYGTISSTNCIVVFTCTMAVTNLLAKLTSINKMMLAQGLQLLGYAIFYFFIFKEFMYYPAIIIFTLGEITNTIATTPFLTRRIPLNYRSRVLSLFSVIEMIFGCLGELLVGIIYDNYGYSQSWIFTMLIMIVTILLFQSIKKLDKKSYPELYKNNIA